jgi:hypothetical protein
VVFPLSELEAGLSGSAGMSRAVRDKQQYCSIQKAIRLLGRARFVDKISKLNILNLNALTNFTLYSSRE